MPVAPERTATPSIYAATCPAIRRTCPDPAGAASLWEAREAGRRARCGGSEACGAAGVLTLASLMSSQSLTVFLTFLVLGFSSSSSSSSASSISSS